MPLRVKAKIGFIGSSAPSSPHHESFKAFIPEEIDFTFVQEETAGGSLYDARGKVDSLIGQTVALVDQHRWDGVIISGRSGSAQSRIVASSFLSVESSCCHCIEFLRGCFEGILD